MAIIMRNGIAYGGGGGGNETKEISFADYQALVNTPAYDSDIIYFITDANIDDITSPNYNGNLSDFFSISTDYMVGDYCIFNNQLYEFIEDKPAGDWDETKVKTTTIKEKLNELNSNLSGLNFAQDSEGNWGYIPSGADSVIPFKKGYENTPATATASQIESGYTAWVNGNKLTGTMEKVVYQTGSGTFYSGGYTSNNHVVTFPSAFSKAPTVYVTRTGYTPVESDRGACNPNLISISSITKTSFTFTISNDSRDASTVGVKWIAILA